MMSSVNGWPLGFATLLGATCFTDGSGGRVTYEVLSGLILFSQTNVVVVWVHVNVLHAQIVRVFPVTFCFAPLTEPFLLLVPVALLLVSAFPPHDAIGQ